MLWIMDEAGMTIGQTAARLGISRDTVMRRIQSGELPAHKFGPRSYRVAPGDLQEFIGKSAVGGRGESAEG